MGCCKSLIDQLSDNAVPEDPAQTEQDIRNEHPRILQEDEKVEMAFRGRGGKGRDVMMFTSKRILVRDVQGFGDKLEYRSCPYHTVRAFAVETAGSMDRSVEMKVWAKGIGKLKMKFVHDSVDIFSLKRYLNAKVLPRSAIGAPPTTGVTAGPDSGKVMELLHFLDDNAKMLDAGEIEAKLRSDVDFLGEDERVEMAYKCGRDFTCFTNLRMLMVNVQGLSGTRREYCSILWEYCSCLSVETPGTFFDVDSELVIYTRVSGKGHIKQDLAKGGANILEVNAYLSDKILGMDTEPGMGIPKTPDEQKAAGESSSAGKAGGLMAWLGDDMKMLDPKEADVQFHAGGSAPILQGCETVEMAFKGRRDMVLFTTKRYVDVNVKGLISKSTKYTSIPWSAIKVFAVESAGTFDNDSEIKLWLEVDDITPGKPGNENEAETPPDPGISYVTQDLRKDKVDLFAIQKYLAQRIIPKDGKQVYKPAEVEVEGEIKDANADSGILDWIGNNAMQVDPKQIDAKFRNSPPILLDDENTIMAFKCGRDLTVYTTRRIIRIDTQGITGKKVEYQSIPYNSIKAFSVESAGSWDRDAEVKVYVHSPWMPEISQDFRKGQADIIALQSFLAAQVIGNEDGSSGLSEAGTQAASVIAEAAAKNAGGISDFFAWIGNDAHAISAEDVDKEFHTSPPILMSDEKTEMAFKCGRDLFVITTKRFLKVDTQGFTGQRVEYLTIPLKHCASFAVESAGRWDFDGETKVCTDIPARDYYANTWDWSVSQDFRKGQTDIMTVHEFLTSKLLVSSAQEARL